MFSYDCEEGKDVSVNLNQNVMVKQDDENKIEEKKCPINVLRFKYNWKMFVTKKQKHLLSVLGNVVGPFGFWTVRLRIAHRDAYCQQGSLCQTHIYIAK